VPAAPVEVAWAAPGDVAEIQGFLDAHWKRGHVLARDAELLRWQHRSPRGPDALEIVTARDADGALLGLLGIVAGDVTVRGARRPAAWLTTWIVPPEHRHRQVGLRLLRHVLRNDDTLVGTLGGNEITQRLLGGLRFAVSASVPRWTRPVDAGALERLLAAGPRPTSGRRVPPRAAAPAGVEVRELDPAAWDAAWLRDWAPRLVATWRDAAHLRWRYLEHPRLRYEVRTAAEPGGGLGLLVYRVIDVADAGVRVVRVLDLLAEPGGVAGPALLDHVLDRAERERAAFAELWCTSTRVAAPLEAAGFTREDAVEEPLPALFSPLDFRRPRLSAAVRAPIDLVADSTALLGDADVYLTRADCDQDRPN
jgi:hypothetical protein